MNRTPSAAGPREYPFLDRAADFVENSFVAAGNPLILEHLRRTLFWLLELEPAVGEALRIAALAHDIERAFREEEVYARMFTSARVFRDPAFLAYHQERSAKIIAAHLVGIGAPPALRDKVFYLVSRHEIGGDPETDLLRDADSLSFFEVNTDLFVTVKVKEAGPQAVREKFDWMFSRITIPKARKLCRPLYAAACRRLVEAGNPAGGVNGMKLVIFDFEGTLVDFQWQLKAALDELHPRLEPLLAKADIAPAELSGLDYCRLYNFLGAKIPDLALQRETLALVDEIFDRFDADAADRWRLNPGARELLASLKDAGFRLALDSNVGRKALDRMLEKLALDAFFPVTVSRDEVLRLKPDPEGIGRIRAFFGREISSSAPALLVGDSVTDIETARAAGIAVAVITNGEDRTARLRAHAPDHLIDNLSQLENILLPDTGR